MPPPENPEEVDETTLLFLFQGVLQSLTLANDEKMGKDQEVARRKVAEMPRVLADPEILDTMRYRIGSGEGWCQTSAQVSMGRRSACVRPSPRRGFPVQARPAP